MSGSDSQDMKTPTKKQISQQIAALKKMKPRVLHYNGFGDDHHAAIDAQISVLDNHLSEDDICDRQNECRDTECPYYEDDVDYAVESVFENALEAAKWLDGTSEYKTLTENWKQLVDVDPAKILRPSKSILR